MQEPKGLVTSAQPTIGNLRAWATASLLPLHVGIAVAVLAHLCAQSPSPQQILCNAVTDATGEVTEQCLSPASVPGDSSIENYIDHHARGNANSVNVPKKSSPPSIIPSPSNYDGPHRGFLPVAECRSASFSSPGVIVISGTILIYGLMRRSKGSFDGRLLISDVGAGRF